MRAKRPTSILLTALMLALLLAMPLSAAPKGTSATKRRDSPRKFVVIFDRTTLNGRVSKGLKVLRAWRKAEFGIMLRITPKPWHIQMSESAHSPLLK
ncbi:MAG: hypothetical protein KC502_21325 [Myxococcales bacterium]|nr:hypothetical protein [Myxococcales bacterium]